MASSPTDPRPAFSGILALSDRVVGTHENCLFRSMLYLFFSSEYPVRHLREFRAKALANGRYFTS